MAIKILPLYEKLLSRTNLNPEIRAKIEERIRSREDADKKEKAASKSRRLRTLEDLSLLKPCRLRVMEPDLKFGEQCIAPDTQLAPKDGRELSTTRDYLFLATLLERSREADYILQCGPSGKNQEWIYLPDNHQELIPEGFALKHRVSPQEVSLFFEECFFLFRRTVATRGRCEMSLSIGGVEVRHAGSRGDRPFWNFAARLDHPFTRDEDSLLENLHAGRLFDFPETKASGKTRFLCPVDGAVTAIEGKITNPRGVWRGLCGREWRVALCPHCLGELAQAVPGTSWAVGEAGRGLRSNFPQELF